MDVKKEMLLSEETNERFESLSEKYVHVQRDRRDTVALANLLNCYEKIRSLRNGNEPNMCVEEFVNYLVEFYRKGHCPECTGVTIIIKPCSCKATERL